MAQISKRLLEKEIYDEIFNTFLKTIAKLDTPNQVSLFFNDFLTKTERIMLSKRLALGILIAEKKDYREISNLLKVSAATISKFNLLYKYGAGYRKIVDDIRKNREIREFLIDLGVEMSSIGSWGGKGSGTWRGVKRSLQDKKSKLLQ